MNTELKEMVNEIWDAVSHRAPGDDNGYYDPDAIVARALNIPKWKAIEARRGYRRPAVKRGPSMPRVSILEASHAA